MADVINCARHGLDQVAPVATAWIDEPALVLERQRLGRKDEATGPANHV